MSLFYDKEGKPLETLEWAVLFEDPEYQVIAQEEVLGPTGEVAWVSTIWLGVPQNLSGLEGHGPPVIFETAIFWQGERINIWDRYATEQAARDGHRFLVQAMTDGITTDGITFNTSPERKRNEG